MKRIFVTLVWILTAAVFCSAQTYFPQIANGIQNDGVTWKTTVFVTNPAPSGSSTATGSIAFTMSSGAPFNISFVDSNGSPAGSGNTIPFSITGGQTRKFVSNGAGTLAVGYGTLSTNASVIATVVFSEFAANGALISEAGVPTSSALTRQAVFVDTQSGFDTGVAYANPNAESATISLQLFNTQGVAVLPSTTRSLAGTMQAPAFVSQVFPGQAVAGTMQITSSVPLAAVALRFSATGQFTTLPTISLASLINPAVEWLQERLWLNPLTSFARLLGALQFRLG